MTAVRTQTRLGVCSMDDQPNIGTAACPPPKNRCWRKIDRRSKNWSASALGTNGRFGNSRNVCWYSCSAWACADAADVGAPPLSAEPGAVSCMKGYRLGDAYAERKLKTACGEVSYGRAHLIREGGGTGFHPLDVALGLTGTVSRRGLCSS